MSTETTDRFIRTFQHVMHAHWVGTIRVLRFKLPRDAYQAFCREYDVHPDMWSVVSFFGFKVVPFDPVPR